MKKVIKIAGQVLAFIGIFIILTAIPIRLLATDSGFDSSYDSGGSSYDSGSSSYDSGSSSYDSFDDDDDDWGSSSGSSSSSGDINFAIIIIVFVIIMLIITRNTNSSSNLVTESKPSKILSLTTRKRIDPTIVPQIIKNFDPQAFLQDRYRDFVKIQKCWMDFDYDGLRALVTDELYNQYEMQLETLKMKHQKNVMTDFAYMEGIITNAQKGADDTYAITIELLVNFYDYIVENQVIVRGTNSSKIVMHYQMTFVTKLKNNVKTCSNCGAELTEKSFHKCEYCGTIIDSVPTGWVLSKKECLGQNFIK